MKSKQKIFRLICSGYLLALLLFGFANQARAQILPNPINTNTTAPSELPQYNKGVDTSIRDYLCTPEDSNLGGALYTCIGRLYRFGISFGSIALVFFIVLAGYMYLTGGETAKGKAKGILLSAFTGMGLLLSSYLLLHFINPDLTNFKSIQPPIFTAVLPKCEDVGYGVNCILTTGGVYTPGTAGNADEQQYSTMINQYAQLRNIEYCKLSALMRKESSFIYNNVSNAPPTRVDVSASPPTYNITNFDSNYHAIGLTQITIYERRRGLTSGWTNGVPARAGAEFGHAGPLYVKDLIDPETNIAAGSFLWAHDLNLKNNDIREAYRLYQGSASAQSTLDALLQMYNECKARG
jgi:hypothetical protein